jgi:plasmid stabilization system protein ParE
MARLIYAERAFEDLERLVDFLLTQDGGAALATVELIEEAVRVLERHPLIGRAAEGGLRELVISRGRTGYVALYSHEPSEDVVLILGLRHQREAGFRECADDDPDSDA